MTVNDILRASISDTIYHGANDECNLSRSNCDALATAAIARFHASLTAIAKTAADALAALPAEVK